MMHNLSIWLVVALASGVLAAGCGSSSSTSTSQTTTTPAALSPAAAAQAVTTCKQKIQAQPSLSASAKAKLEEACGNPGSVDQAAVRKATQEACVALLNASHVPAGAARERALAICKAP